MPRLQGAEVKSRKKREAAEAAKLEAAQQFAVQKIQQQREMAKLQLSVASADPV